MRIQRLVRVLGGALLAVGSGGALYAQQPGAATCASLTDFHTPNLTITSATGSDGPTSIKSGPGTINIATPFCRVIGYLTPTSDSHIGFELWLPAPSVWNHKYEAVGNGGFAGSVNLRAMMPGISRGYATMTTDLGHLNPPDNPVEDVTWAYQHPEKAIDYSYRAEHVATLASKQLISAYYGSNPTHSYYTGCSAGGIQGMTEMLRFPADYDGYVIGDGTPDHMGQEIGAMWNALAASLANEAEALKPSQLTAVHNAILQQCAGKDGGVSTDPFLSNPAACKFDPKTLLCAAGQDPASCLSPTQVDELNKIYGGPVDPVTHKQILAGLSPDSEMTWDRFFSGKKNPVGVERPWAGFMTDIAMSDPDYLTQERYLKFNFGSDLKAAQERKLGATETVDEVFNSRSRNLDPVKQEGGKIIQYHGWDDGNIPPMEAVNLFNSVVADQAKRHHLSEQKAQEETEQFYRLFMVQGMGHCAGGAGPSSFGQGASAKADDDPQQDTLTALEQWVEKGVAPEQFIGSRVDQKTKSVDMTRPICAYPKTPVYKGAGSVNDASNFICEDASQLQHDHK